MNRPLLPFVLSFFLLFVGTPSVHAGFIADFWERMVEASSDSYDWTTDKTSKGWEWSKEKTTNAYDWSVETSKSGWIWTRNTTSDAYDATSRFVRNHKGKIAVAAAAVAAAALTIAYFKTSEDPPSFSDLYDNLKSKTTVSPGAPFSQNQKEMILNANRERNDGFLRSDQSGDFLVEPEQYFEGYSPPSNEAQIDHIFPRSRGGANSFDNAQVLSREENLLKSDAVP